MEVNYRKFSFHVFYFPYYFVDQKNKRLIKIKRRHKAGGGGGAAGEAGKEQGQADPALETKVSACGSFWQAIQILIGLLHIGLGFVMASILPGYYIAVSFVGGFPFWGSIWVSNVSPSASEFPESVNTHSGPPCQVVLLATEVFQPRQHAGCDSSSGLGHQAYKSAWAITDWVAKQQTFVIAQIGRQEVQDQGVGTVFSSVASLRGLHMAVASLASSHDLRVSVP